MKHNTKTTLFLLLALVISGGMFAQDEYYRVYQFETPCKGHLEVTNWTTFVGKSSGDYEHYGKTYSRESLLASSLELEYGVTDHFVLAVQWHPERSFDEDKRSQAIFSALVEAARERHGELEGEFETA